LSVDRPVAESAGSAHRDLVHHAASERWYPHKIDVTVTPNRVGFVPQLPSVVVAVAESLFPPEMSGIRLSESREPQVTPPSCATRDRLVMIGH
jgi:hypothetical protein